MPCVRQRSPFSHPHIPKAFQTAYRFLVPQQFFSGLRSCLFSIGTPTSIYSQLEYSDSAIPWRPTGSTAIPDPTPLHPGRQDLAARRREAALPEGDTPEPQEKGRSGRGLLEQKQ